MCQETASNKVDNVLVRSKYSPPSPNENEKKVTITTYLCNYLNDVYISTGWLMLFFYHQMYTKFDKTWFTLFSLNGTRGNCLTTHSKSAKTSIKFTFYFFSFSVVIVGFSFLSFFFSLNNSAQMATLNNFFGRFSLNASYFNGNF